MNADANPSVTGSDENGDSRFDDQFYVSKNQKSQESKVSEYDYRSNVLKKKKKSAEQCELEEEFKKDKKYGDFAYKLDKNGNPIFRVDTETGSEIFLTYDKALKKYYHQDVYPFFEAPKNFDAKKTRSLKPKDWIKYLRKTIPQHKVIQFQIANAKSLSSKNLLKVSGFIDARR